MSQQKWVHPLVKMSKLGPISHFPSLASCDSLVIQGLRCELLLHIKMSTVAKTIQRYNRAGSTQSGPRHGWPKKLSAHAQRHIQRLSLENMYESLFPIYAFCSSTLPLLDFQWFKLHTVEGLHPNLSWDLYCHYCYLYNFYKSPFKLSWWLMEARRDADNSICIVRQPNLGYNKNKCQMNIRLDPLLANSNFTPIPKLLACIKSC